MIDLCISYIRRHDLLQSGARVLVAVSGGADSVVLLDLLARLAPTWRFELTVAHFNHQLRGAEAERDEAFVRELCAAAGLPCVTGRGDVRTYARTSRLSIEAAGRELRYRFLFATARERNCGIIATGHHAGDQAETVLDRLIRGAGVRGLAGISPRREITAAEAQLPEQPTAADSATPCGPLLLIRPLLCAGRAEIEAYAGKRGLQYRRDASNLDRRIRRNRLRHDLLPLLAAYNPAIESVLGHTAEHLREVEAYLCREAEAVLGRCVVQMGGGKIILEKEPFLSYFLILQKYALRKAMHALGEGSRDLDEAFWMRWQQFVAAGRMDRSLPAGTGEIWLTGRHLVLLRERTAALEAVIPVGPGTRALWDGWSLEIKAVSLPLEQIEKNKDPRLAWIDADRLQRALYVRALRPGDRFKPLGLQGSKKVADLLAAEAIPVYQRRRMPLLMCGDEIVWVCGIRAGDSFRVTPATLNQYQLKVETNFDRTL
jgi:tRNA(Ile)-lysidine synthase